LGLNWLDQIARTQVRGEELSGTRQYDASMMIYYEGGPSQADSFDPKPGTSGSRYPAVRVPGMVDIYGEPVFVSELIASLSSVIGPERKQGLGKIEMGFIRSMHHGIPVHQFAQKFTTGFWQSPIGFRYPPAASVMAQYFKDHARTTGLPGSVFIRGDTGRDANTQRGAKVPTALEVIGNPTGMDLMPILLSSADGRSYRKRRELIEVFSRKYNSNRSESEISGWTTALDQAVELTLKGISADAFTVDNSSLLAAANDEIYVGWKQRFTLAQQLIKRGVPFLNVGIGGNDDGHFNNQKAVEGIFGQTTNDLVRETILSLEEWCVDQGKRVLILLGGEFGRTPHQVGDNNGHPTREHWASGFTWALVSINHPTFKSTAVGDTGPDGSYTVGEGNLIHPVRPSAVGGLLYTVMGFPPEDSRNHIETIDGLRSPVDLDFVRQEAADGSVAGNTPWLMDQFGLS
jgi:hypothetical protein